MDNFKPFNKVLIFCILSIVIYLYFFHARTTTIYGDDLAMYREHLNVKNIFDRINSGKANEKFRPVWGFIVNFLIDFFNRSLIYYYIVNAGVQVINTYVLF